MVVLECKFWFLFQLNYKPKGEVTESPRALAKFYKEALRVKQVLSANSDIFAQVNNCYTLNIHIVCSLVPIQQILYELGEKYGKFVVVL
jgi:hypothetical protein